MIDIEVYIFGGQIVKSNDEPDWNPNMSFADKHGAL